MSIIDFHNHLIPGVDDGAQTEADTAAALQVLSTDGVTGLIATPHVNASMVAAPAEHAARVAELTAGWRVLQRCAEAAGMAVWRGAEVALDTPWTDFSDPALRLNGTRFILVEFAYMSIPPASAHVLGQLGEAGWTPVLAHPERYRTFSSIEDLAPEWRAAGALLQLNGASLLGRYGDGAERVARELLAGGHVDYVCSDYHARGRARIAEYRQLIEEEAGAETATLLMETNPRRLVDDLPPLPIAPASGTRPQWRTRWRRFFR